jgi:hypothetical protein
LFLAYYLLDGGKRDIVDRLTATEGTEVNWRMMEMVIAEVRKLDMFVEQHDAGDYDVGRSFGFLHTMNWTNCNKNYMVSNGEQHIVFYILFVSNTCPRCLRLLIYMFSLYQNSTEIA